MLLKPLRDLLATVTVVAAAAFVVAPVAVADPGSADPAVAPVADQALPCCAENLPEVVEAAHVEMAPQLLPPAPVSEQGLQIKTILTGRSISAAFPQIHSMIGVRPDAKPWHPSGRAIDFMIPNAGSAEGIALGDAVLAYALSNADRFGIQDVIWRGTYYTPAGPSGSGYGHYDHVHITTTGGGYPTGGDEYLREG